MAIRLPILFLATVATGTLHHADAFVQTTSPISSSLDRPVSSALHGKTNDIDNDIGSTSQPDCRQRRSFLSVTATAASLFPLRASASATSSKKLNLSSEDLKEIILSDIVDKSFLVTADITRDVYDESATFTDEIDVYTMDKWIKGTKSLFIPSGSRVSLVGDVNVSPSEVSFRFDEDLMFNIPFKPVCSLTGRVVLTRDANTGLITSYREYWDQSVNEVLKTAKFGKKA
mmetsp:Transcript_344/g.640  ORF Transcript_344/g.640 Transcript_344/m.640 type:complete len:230 (+) Transcript_344:185-874(+)